MKGQILKFGVITDIIGNMVGRSPAQIQTVLYLPELKIALTQYGRELFITNDFEPHGKMEVVAEVELTIELTSLIQNWIISQRAVEATLTTHSLLSQYFH